MDESLIRGCMVAKLKDWRVIVAAALLLALVATAAIALSSRASDEESESDEPITAIVDDDDEADSEDGDKTAAVTAPLIDTEATGEFVSPRSSARKTTSTAATPGTTTPGTTPATSSSADDPEWLQYLADTKAVATNNYGDMTGVIAAVTAALGSGDQAALADLLAFDEGGQAAYLSELADKYPTILASQPGSTVNIFSAGGTTVYFGYSIVEWTDAGIVSEHTIPIMLRFVNGEWVLTTLGEMPDIEFVQSVQI